jgi:predicted transcriptional regulator
MDNPYDEYGFAGKWSPEIKAHGFTQVPNLLLVCQGHLGLTDGEMITLLQLFTFWYRKNSPVYPSINRVTKRSKKGYSTTQRRLKSLEDKGFIERKRKQGKSTRYDLLPCVRRLYQHQKECKDNSRKRESLVVNVTRVPYSKPTNEEYEAERKRIYKKNVQLFSEIAKSRYGGSL